MTYLDYYKNVLTKVSFDPHLFHKEYRKATRYLHSEELNDLNEWLAFNGFHDILYDQPHGDGIALYPQLGTHGHWQATM